ncbi:polysaccharide biosynthesis protein [Thalassobacillus devorans]|uniref:Polysaccharide biosynthesis protein n=1 Tax=Thalassobacillus devorans TaxID=279813 RepID=A0ABQ1NU90_9BACI|nr:polysaccharide biosynthesis C-terminal domain-containing protein [Thalassobacillus devorans]NIK28618.1 O-antigen/teichoic acid export membrane protein [Thalassobacillus devorans]GGC84831.1 polysaccharide biosynthesis protein [Thalassobacillus devorans]
MNLNNLGRKSLLVFIGIIFESAIVMLVNILGAKLFGVTAYGDFILVFTWGMFIVSFTKLGFDQSIIAYVTKADVFKEEYEKNNIVVFSLLFSFIFTFVISFLLYINAEFIAVNLLNNPGLDNLFIIQIPIIFLLTFTHISLSILRAFDKINNFTQIKYFLIPSLEILVILLLYIMGVDSIALVIGKYVSLTVAIIGIFYLFKNITSIHFFKYLHLYKKFIIFSLPLVLSGLIVLTISRIDILMIGYYLEGDKVGIYNIIVQISKVSLIILSTINTIFTPIFSKLYVSKEYERLKNTYRSTTRWITFFTLVYLCEIIIFNEEITAVLGENFKQGTVVLILLTIGYFIDTSVGSVANMNTMTGRPSYNLYSSLLVIILNIVLNIIFIPKYGINGAAIATMTAVSLSNILKLVLLYRHTKIQPYNIYYLKLFLSAAGSLIITMGLKEVFSSESIFMHITIFLFFIIIYIFSVALLKVSDEDKQMLTKYIKKIR